MAGIPDIEISDRHERILDAIVRLFIESANPVGSRTVSKNIDLEWSAATIRNVMADLEDAGLLRQPHLSAGRVPTENAFRYWITRNVKPKRPGAELQERIRSAVAAARTPRDKLAVLTTVLSESAHSAGVALVPKWSQGRLARAEVVPMGAGRVLFLWVTQRGTVYHRHLQLSDSMSAERAETLERILNIEYQGQTFDEVTSRIREDLQRLKHEYDEFVEKLLAGAESDESGVIIEGLNRVIEQPEFGDIDFLRRLYDAFEDRHRLFLLLDRISHSGGLQVLLNEDTGFADLNGIGLVAAPFGASEASQGSIGLFGPSRMPYPQILGLVKYASDVLSDALAEGSDDGPATD